MVVNELNVMRIPILPAKAHTRLLVDANAVLSGSLAFELLESVAGWDSEIIELLCSVDGNEFRSLSHLT
ncbi:MAG TPA: hypothetical protein VES88_15200 [Gemmatimonadaceae bacterium]|nr:hypothetical protein [Gemmatimonadaceae bacterium]